MTSESPKINHKFAAYATSIAFNLTLSRPMVVQLAEIALRRDSVISFMRSLGMRDTAVGAMRQLERRGLCYAPDPEWPGCMKLTEAGEHVFKLLQIAGIIDPIAESIKGTAGPQSSTEDEKEQSFEEINETP